MAAHRPGAAQSLGGLLAAHRLGLLAAPGLTHGMGGGGGGGGFIAIPKATNGLEGFTSGCNIHHCGSEFYSWI